MASINVIEGVGWEMFAKQVFDFVAPKVKVETHGRVSLFSVECFEHGANSAIVHNPYGSTI